MNFLRNRFHTCTLLYDHQGETNQKHCKRTLSGTFLFYYNLIYYLFVFIPCPPRLVLIHFPLFIVKSVNCCPSWRKTSNKASYNARLLGDACHHHDLGIVSFNKSTIIKFRQYAIKIPKVKTSKQSENCCITSHYHAFSLHKCVFHGLRQLNKLFLLKQTKSLKLKTDMIVLCIYCCWE